MNMTNIQNMDPSMLPTDDDIYRKFLHDVEQAHNGNITRVNEFEWDFVQANRNRIVFSSEQSRVIERMMSKHLPYMQGAKQRRRSK